jgi:tetratricopeptide (TPR) repeat protein
VLDVTRNNGMMHTNYGTILMKQGNRAEGERHFREALLINKRNHIVLCNLGLIERERGNLDKALDYYLAAVAAEPSFAPAHGELAITYDLLGRFADCERESRAALNIDPDYSPAEHSLAIALAGLKQYPEAVRHFRRTIALGPDIPQKHRQLGDALTAMGAVDEGTAERAKALSMGTIDVGNSHLQPK